MYALREAYLCNFVFANANKEIRYDLSIHRNIEKYFVKIFDVKSHENTFFTECLRVDLHCTKLEA